MSVYNFVDMTGMRLPLGTVVKRSAPTIHGAVLWLYACDCGKARWLRSNNLRRSPPKTHKFCGRGREFVAEGVDSVRKPAYTEAIEMLESTT